MENRFPQKQSHARKVKLSCFASIEQCVKMVAETRPVIQNHQQVFVRVRMDGSRLQSAGKAQKKMKQAA